MSATHAPDSHIEPLPPSLSRWQPLGVAGELQDPLSPQSVQLVVPVGASAAVSWIRGPASVGATQPIGICQP